MDRQKRRSGPATNGPAKPSRSSAQPNPTSVARSLRCACGKAMVATDYTNSGTTYVSRACPELIEAWGPIRSVRRRAVPPHQFEVRTKPGHAATGCCDIREVLVRP